MAALAKRILRISPRLEVGVIDHHQAKHPRLCGMQMFVLDYGSTATMMVEYYSYFSLLYAKACCHSFIGRFEFWYRKFTRAVGTADLRALLYLQARADNEMVNKICRNQVEFDELQLFNAMLSSMRREKMPRLLPFPKGVLKICSVC